MMKKELLKSVTGFFAAVIFFCVSCSKNDGGAGASARVNMYLTDDPSDYDAVYLDIQSVEVTMSGSSAVTLTPIVPGIYDILSFRNGLDTLLLRADLPAGTIQQIRLILGNDNAVVVNGTSYPLNTPSGQESGVKLNLNQSFTAGGSYNIWIDFDAGKSILQTGNGTYKLKPVIRAYSALTDARIRGYVLPLSSLTTVYAINGADTSSAIPNSADGYFRFSGLSAGTYQVWFHTGLTTSQDTLLTGVPATYGNETDLGTIVLYP